MGFCSIEIISVLTWCVERQVVCGGMKDMQIIIKYYCEAIKVTVIALHFGPQVLDGS